MQLLREGVEIGHRREERLPLLLRVEPGQVELVAERQRQERRTVPVCQHDAFEFLAQELLVRQDVLWYAAGSSAITSRPASSAAWKYSSGGVIEWKRTALNPKLRASFKRSRNTARDDGGKPVSTSMLSSP